MLKIAIVEDDKAMAETLKRHIDTFSSEKKEVLSTQLFRTTTDFLSSPLMFDIVFFDIQFENDMDGIKAAKRLREKDSSVTIVFVTSFRQFAVKGYEVEAYDFIVKPVEYSDFSLRMSRIIKHVYKEKDDSVSLRTGGAQKVISVQELKYIEVAGHTVYYHTTGGVIDGPGALKEVEKQLEGKGFARCNNCYLVNLRYVESADGQNIVVGGEKLAISRPRKKDFMSALNKYLGN